MSTAAGDDVAAAPRRRRLQLATMEAVVLLLAVLLAGPFCAAADQPPSDNNNPYYDNNGMQSFNPTMAIVIVVIVSAFFLLGFFSIYIRQCGESGGSGAGAGAAAAIGGSRRGRERGLHPEVLEAFPTVVYSEVKGMKIGKSAALECAVCLNEFDDDDELRILPNCSHVFHTDCIGAWLASHVTCPVCRANLSDPHSGGSAPFDLTAAAAADQSSPSSMDRPMIPTPPADQIAVDVEEVERMADLARIGTERRAARSNRFPGRAFSRSHSTGHSTERFTLRLPEHVHKQIVVGSSNAAAAARIQRNNSSGGGDGSSSSRWPGAWFGRSDRWPSFLGRTISVWGSSRRGDAEGTSSARKGDAAGEGSFKGRLQAVGRAPLECLGGGAGKVEDGDGESSTVALARV